MPRQTDQPVIAIVGATGLVGREFLEILSGHGLGRGDVRAFASARSAGGTVAFGDTKLDVRQLSPDVFAGVGLAFFCAGGDVSRDLAPAAARQGAVVIDNSSAFRMQPDVPLVIPEINGDVLDCATPGIVANPNCSTIIALMAVTPLHRAVGVDRMVVSTYQAASGAGAALVAELEQQARDHVAGRPRTQKVLDRPYLFNLFCHDSAVGPDGYNEEERKLVRETHKIWADETVRITATCVRVPVLRAHSEAINLTFRRALAEDEARALLAAAPGVRLVDDRTANRFPEPAGATGIDDVLVGRIRADVSQPPGMGLDLFVSGDQLRKGAALNAVQIAERIFATESAAV
ncbi:MAG: aspartate-semialdehyde dehydrogenase [Planctomycetota bacterium]|jgi:aspartate-semialdehyde dehydrogenase